MTRALVIWSALVAAACGGESFQAAPDVHGLEVAARDAETSDAPEGGAPSIPGVPIGEEASANGCYAGGKQFCLGSATFATDVVWFCPVDAGAPEAKCDPCLSEPRIQGWCCHE